MGEGKGREEKGFLSALPSFFGRGRDASKREEQACFLSGLPSIHVCPRPTDPPIHSHIFFFPKNLSTDEKHTHTWISLPPSKTLSAKWNFPPPYFFGRRPQLSVLAACIFPSSSPSLCPMPRRVLYSETSATPRPPSHAMPGQHPLDSRRGKKGSRELAGVSKACNLCRGRRRRKES